MSDGFSMQTIEHLAYLITGGEYGSPDQAPPPYRKGHQITSWMKRFVPGFDLGGRSRIPAVRDCLDELLPTPEGHQTLESMVAAALDPRDFAYHKDELERQISAFNSILHYDGYRLLKSARGLRLESIVEVPVPVRTLNDTLETLEWEPVERDFYRMLENCEVDPEDSITSACALVESVCRSILTDLQVPIPKKRAVKTLYETVAEELGIAVKRKDLPEDVAEESRRILGGLANVTSGIGELRTKVGDAHGREHTVRRVDPRIARLAIGSAATVTQFLIETWRLKAKNEQSNQLDTKSSSTR